MTYPQPSPLDGRWIKTITFCSCVSNGTELEQNSTNREIAVMWIRAIWIRDALAGAGLIIFMVSCFALASGAHAILSAI
jgi:hypothetical protein